MRWQHAIKLLTNTVGSVFRVEPVPIGKSSTSARTLRRISKLSGPVATVIDVGASDGRWSEEAIRLWPDANFLFFEAQEVHRTPLDRLVSKNPKFFAEFRAASNSEGNIHFFANNPFGGAASKERFDEHDIVVPCTTVDLAVSRKNLPGPYLLKLDTHGHEREILQGAEQVLRNTSIVIIEAYNFPSWGRMLFWELCAKMDEYGFSPAGIADPLVRGFDGMLWQLDIVFLPKSVPAFSNPSWDKPWMTP